MSERENVTISLPLNLVREAKHLAIDHGVSLSRFVAMILEERVRADRQYQVARERQLKLMREGLDLGIGEQAPWSRDELHER